MQPWQCNWCPQAKGKQRPGPNGPKTLCDKCYARWRKGGETGPRSADWSCGWCGADESETTRRCKDLCETCHAHRSNGATGPPAKNWRCDWCPTTTGPRRKGPNGYGTLCEPCGDRFSRGKTGPPSATFECRWSGRDVHDVGAVVFFNLCEDGAFREVLEPAGGRAQSYGRLERGRRRRHRGEGG